MTRQMYVVETACHHVACVTSSTILLYHLTAITADCLQAPRVLSFGLLYLQFSLVLEVDALDVADQPTIENGTVCNSERATTEMSPR